MSERAYPNPFTPNSPRYPGTLSGVRPAYGSEWLGQMNEAARSSVEGKSEPPTRIEGRENRAKHLREIPKHGFEFGNTSETWATERILDAGLPVDNFKAITLERNVKGREMVLGSWGIGRENIGVFSVYELLQRQTPEKQLGTIIHESVHANTPLNSENGDVHGSEENRAEAERFVRAAAQQALATGEHLNTYHKGLLLKCQAGIITEELFAEETGAIMAEMAMTNRRGLEEAQERTHKALEDKIRAREIAPQDKVFLMSGENKKGEMQVRGVDVMLINLVDDVHNFEELTDRIDTLKANFYPDKSLAKASQRGTARTFSAIAA